jgi:hypothetical protein
MMPRRPQVAIKDRIIPQIRVAAAYKADDQSLSVGEASNFSGTNQPPKKFIPLYTFSEIKT